MNSRHLIDANEGSRLTGLRPQTLYRLARRGQIQAFKLLRPSVRFDREELLRLIGSPDAGSAETPGANVADTSLLRRSARTR